MTLVAIHQPNFFPWAGYFAKIIQADTFIFLDHVQLSRGTWTNRVKLLISGEAKWATAAVKHGSSSTAINEAVLDTGVPWKRKLLASLDASYRKAPFYARTMDVVRPLIEQAENNLARFNISAILRLADEIGVARDKFLTSSHLDARDASTRLLIELIRAADGDTYLCGGGAGGYQDDQLFTTAGISLLYQSFNPAPYTQHGSAAFVPGLSIIDAVMNLGLEGTRLMLDGAIAGASSGVGQSA